MMVRRFSGTHRTGLMVFLALVVLTFGPIAPRAAYAEVSFLSFGMAGFFEQFDDLGPPEAFRITSNMLISGEGAGQATAWSVTFPGAASPIGGAVSEDVIPPFPPDFPGGTFFNGSYFSDPYTDLATFSADYQPGTYTFALSGGALGDVSGAIDVPSEFMFDSIPRLTGTTYSRLQEFDPSRDFTLTWEGFPIPDDATSVSLRVLMNPSGLSGNFFNAILDPTATSLVVPAGTLSPLTEYRLFMNLIVVRRTEVASLNGVPFELSRTLSLQANFVTTIPEPSSLTLSAAGIGLLAAGGFLKARREWRRGRPEAGAAGGKGVGDRFRPSLRQGG